MCGQMDSWDLSSLPPKLLDARLTPNYDHVIFVGGTGWGRIQLLDDELFGSARDDDFYREYHADFTPDDRPIDEVVWQHFRDRIKRSDHAPNDDHGSLRLSTALRGSGERVG